MQKDNLKSALYGFVGAGTFWALAHSGPAVAQIQVLPAFLRLQATTPGTAQSGHANVTGTMIAGQFQGGGAAVTGLNASNLASGTVPDSRLTLGGDLTGPLSSATVSKIQGNGVNGSNPTNGQILKFFAGFWQLQQDGLNLPYSSAVQSGQPFAMVVKNEEGLGILGQSFGTGSGVQGTSGNLSQIFAGAGVTGVSIVSGCFGIKGIAQQNAEAAADFTGYNHDVRLGSSTAAIETDGFLWRDYVAGNPGVAVPLAYGTVNAAGTIAGGTGNFTVNKTATGTYTVTVNGESYTNSSHTVSVTPVSSVPRTFGVVNPGNGGFLIRFWDPASALSDTQFQFTVWTPHPASSG